MHVKNPGFDAESLRSWNSVLSELFPQGTPAFCEWNDLNSIVNVLNTIGRHENSNHTFFPSGGGLDLTNCRLSDLESGCIEIDFDGIADLVKTNTLSFNSFGSNNELSYFRIELINLEPTGVYEKVLDEYEELTVTNGRYYMRSIFDSGEFNGNPLPPETRVICRQWGGSLLIFCKASPYNKTPSTYEAKFARMNKDDFYKLIKEIHDKLAGAK